MCLGCIHLLLRRILFCKSRRLCLMIISFPIQLESHFLLPHRQWSRLLWTLVTKDLPLFLPAGKKWQFFFLMSVTKILCFSLCCKCRTPRCMFPPFSRVPEHICRRFMIVVPALYTTGEASSKREIHSLTLDNNCNGISAHFRVSE